LQSRSGGTSAFAAAAQVSLEGGFREPAFWCADDTVCTGAGAPTHHFRGLRNATHDDMTCSEQRRPGVGQRGLGGSKRGGTSSQASPGSKGSGAA